MSLLSSIIAQAEGLAASPQNIFVIGVCGVGVLFFVNWLVIYSGPAALAFCPVRRNNMPVHLPLIAIGVWLACVAGASWVVIKFIDAPDWLLKFFQFLGMTVIELVMIGPLLFVAWRHFARRLKGFGLCIQTAGRDLVFAVVNFITVYPLVLGLLWVVVWIGEFINPDFEMQVNEGLTALTEYDQLWLKVLVIFLTVIVVPVFEEILFRGLLQSMLTGFVGRPWPAILIASFAFTSMHSSWMHFPALFVLSMALGYAYEKSGSMLRPIFIHAIFNATSITLALLAG